VGVGSEGERLREKLTLAIRGGEEREGREGPDPPPLESPIQHCRKLRDS
jgi:hypothetical protein